MRWGFFYGAWAGTILRTERVTRSGPVPLPVLVEVFLNSPPDDL